MDLRRHRLSLNHINRARPTATSPKAVATPAAVPVGTWPAHDTGEHAVFVGVCSEDVVNVVVDVTVIVGTEVFDGAEEESEAPDSEVELDIFSIIEYNRFKESMRTLWAVEY